jgi:MYXO-CTERM domain-containing protein
MGRWWWVGALVCLAVPAEAWAYGSGIASSSFPSLATGCNGCHSGGSAPTVTLTASATTITPGQQVTLTLTVSRTNGNTAGFNLRTDKAGTFATGGAASSDTQTTAGTAEMTHTAPKSASTGTVNFSCVWTPAAGTTGTVTFTGWGNSTNGTGRTGDYATVATTTVTVTTAPPDAGVQQDAAVPADAASQPDAATGPEAAAGGADASAGGPEAGSGGADGGGLPPLIDASTQNDSASAPPADGPAPAGDGGADGGGLPPLIDASTPADSASAPPADGPAAGGDGGAVVTPAPAGGDSGGCSTRAGAAASGPLAVLLVGLALIARRRRR